MSERKRGNKDEYNIFGLRHWKAAMPFTIIETFSSKKKQILGMDSSFCEFSFRFVYLEKQNVDIQTDSQWANEYIDLASGRCQDGNIYIWEFSLYGI